MFNKAVIFAGGKGTRFLEETKFIPKPMIKANNLPLIIYIINHYKKFSVNEFYILTGYKKEIIENYFEESNEFTNYKDYFKSKDGIKVFTLDTGVETMTGGRLKFLLDNFNLDNFYLTYGDGISNVDINKLTNFHLKNKTIGTITAINPPPRFGILEFKDNLVSKMREKNEIIPTWINGGYFVMNSKIKDYLFYDEPFEQTPLIELTRDRQLSCYTHTGYWQCVDTIRELEILEEDIKLGKYIP